MAPSHDPRDDFARAVFRTGGLLLHASAVAHDERAFLFLGAAGAGKTTPAGRQAARLCSGARTGPRRPQSATAKSG